MCVLDSRLIEESVVNVSDVQRGALPHTDLGADLA
jgi:hypothetical protein